MTAEFVGERILVTGGTGYIGSALVARLRQRNDVHIVTRGAGGAGRLADTSTVRFHVVTEPASQIGELVASVDPTVVFHLATHYERVDDAASLGSMVDTNVRFGSLVLGAAARLADSAVVIAGSHFQFTESGRGAANFYAATKSALATVAAYFGEVHGLRWCQTVLFDVYGPNDPRPKFVNAFLDRTVAGLPVMLPDPEPLHHLVYIDDVVAALLASAHSLKAGAASGEDVFVTSDHPVTPSQVLAEIGLVVGRSPEVADAPYELPPGTIMAPVEGPRPALWQPTVGLHDGLRSVFDDR
ncbi:MAG: NAD-dependent epimerase/dehydratase family protein [Acidimicrobiia bacterium]